MSTVTVQNGSVTAVTVTVAVATFTNAPIVKNSFNIRMGTHGECWRNPIDW